MNPGGLPAIVVHDNAVGRVPFPLLRVPEGKQRADEPRGRVGLLQRFQEGGERRHAFLLTAPRAGVEDIRKAASIFNSSAGLWELGGLLWPVGVAIQLLLRGALKVMSDRDELAFALNPADANAEPPV